MRLRVSLRSMISIVNQTYVEQLAQNGSHYVAALSRYSRSISLISQDCFNILH